MSAVVGAVGAARVCQPWRREERARHPPLEAVRRVAVVGEPLIGALLGSGFRTGRAGHSGPISDAGAFVPAAVRHSFDGGIGVLDTFGSAWCLPISDRSRPVPGHAVQIPEDQLHGRVPRASSRGAASRFCRKESSVWISPDRRSIHSASAEAARLLSLPPALLRRECRHALASSRTASRSPRAAGARAAPTSGRLRRAPGHGARRRSFAARARHRERSASHRREAVAARCRRRHCRRPQGPLAARRRESWRRRLNTPDPSPSWILRTRPRARRPRCGFIDIARPPLRRERGNAYEGAVWPGVPQQAKLS